MRALFLTLSLLPVPALAETLTLQSRASAVTVHPGTALVTHDVSLSLPAGSHQVILPDLPPDLVVDLLRVSAPELRLGALRYRSDLTPPRATPQNPEIAAARARIDQIDAQIQDTEDSAARAQIAGEAAEAQLAFLRGLGTQSTLPNDPEALRALTALIGRETGAAQKAALTAEFAVRGIRPTLKELTEAREDAEQALAALIPEPEDRPLLVLDVIADTAVSNAALSVTFPVEAYWQPTYDLRLTLDPTPRLALHRGAQITQSSGENWQDVALTLSTQDLSDAVAPPPLFPDLRRIFDETELYSTRSRPAASDSIAAAPPLTAPAVVAEAGALQSFPQGLSVSYVWRDPVDVASGADAVRLPFDTLELDAEIVARTVPLRSDAAYLVAKVTNTSGDPLLASDEALRFVDGGLVGSGFFETIEAGADAEIGFGRIDGLSLTRRVIKRGEADRGIINRSNERTEEVRITLKNLTSRNWNVDLRDRVPYSEQEDLVITYRATPDPDTNAVDDKRGVLQWRFDMAPGETATVTTSHRITWPEGQRLR